MEINFGYVDRTGNYYVKTFIHPNGKVKIQLVQKEEKEIPAYWLTGLQQRRIFDTIRSYKDHLAWHEQVASENSLPENISMEEFYESE